MNGNNKKCKFYPVHDLITGFHSMTMLLYAIISGPGCGSHLPAFDSLWCLNALSAFNADQ